MRLIDVDDLGVGRCSKDVLPAAYCAGWNGLLGLIEKAPTVDAVPVVYGQWIEKSAPARKIYFVYSHCGAQENKHTAIKGYYCWRCGAKMDDGGPKC